MADSDRDRRRDAAGVGPYAGDLERLVPLSEMKKWDVADGDPDIRHWEVRTVSGRDIGKVRELLVDPDQGEVVMLEIDLSASDAENARRQLDEACHKFLSNPVIEEYRLELE